MAMVGIAQLVEHLVVVQDVAGSSPVTHPDETAPVLGSGPLLFSHNPWSDLVSRVVRDGDRAHGYIRIGGIGWCAMVTRLPLHPSQRSLQRRVRDTEPAGGGADARSV